MRFIPFIFIAIIFTSCKNPKDIQSSCNLLDIGAIGYQCDSLRAIGEHAKTAQLYFKTGKENQSSELFVYAAWQFSEANKIDSALIAIKKAVDFGMNSPYILDKVGIENKNKTSNLRKDVDLILERIKHKNNSVDHFEIVTTPINRFWSYFDQAVKDTINAKQYLSEFICEGSYAIKDYYHIRYENVDNMYQTMIRKNPEYYTYLKKHITPEKLNKVAEASKKMMVNFSKIYTNAIFPKAYIVPDLINGSGTLTELGLFIGADMFAKSDSMPLKNLDSWQLSTITEFENMTFDLVHELMHFQQSYSDTINSDLLLGKLIEEGVCDFLVTLLTPNNEMSPVMQERLNYFMNSKNKAFVMNELKQDIYGTDLSKWMYNGRGIKDRPSNLGYTIGYLICKSYYDRSSDKKKAIFELLNTNDFSSIIKESDFNVIL